MNLDFERLAQWFNQNPSWAFSLNIELNRNGELNDDATHKETRERIIGLHFPEYGIPVIQTRTHFYYPYGGRYNSVPIVNEED